MTNTTKEKIVEYWTNRIPEWELSVDWIDAGVCCWRCGYFKRLEKCHIIPDALGGADAPENLVLLCKQCHRDAPNTMDKDFFWDWIKSSAVPFYGTFYITQAIKEIESVYDINLEDAFARKQADGQESFKEFLDQEIKNTVVHFGEGQINVSTIAALLKKYLELEHEKDIPVQKKN